MEADVAFLLINICFMNWSCEAKVLAVICFKASGGSLIKTQNQESLGIPNEIYSKRFEYCSVTLGISSSTIIPTCIMRLNPISACNTEEKFSFKTLLICHQSKPIILTFSKHVEQGI